MVGGTDVEYGSTRTPARTSLGGVERSGDLGACSWQRAPRAAAQLGAGRAGLLRGPGQRDRRRENSKPGTPPSEWDVSGVGQTTRIQGFATDISVNQGETVAVQGRHRRSRLSPRHLPAWATTAATGARKVATVKPSAPLPQNQPAASPTPRPGSSTAATGRCRRPGRSRRRRLGHLLRASWCARTDRRREPHLLRRPGRRQPLGPAVPDLGHDLAGLQQLRRQQPLRRRPAPTGRAYKVSYNRPVHHPRHDAPRTGCSTPSTRWCAGSRPTATTSATSPASTPTAAAPSCCEHKVFLSVGHDEYWSGQQRANVEAARDAGVTWRSSAATRSSGRPAGRTASTARHAVPHAGLLQGDARQRQDRPAARTCGPGTWRDPRFSPPADGGRPENALTGTIFTVNCRHRRDRRCPAADGQAAVLAEHVRRHPAAGPDGDARRRTRSATSGTRTSTTASAGRA